MRQSLLDQHTNPQSLLGTRPKWTDFSPSSNVRPWQRPLKMGFRPSRDAHGHGPRVLVRVAAGSGTGVRLAARRIVEGYHGETSTLPPPPDRAATNGPGTERRLDSMAAGTGLAPPGNKASLTPPVASVVEPVHRPSTHGVLCAFGIAPGDGRAGLDRADRLVPVGLMVVGEKRAPGLPQLPLHVVKPAGKAGYAPARRSVVRWP